MRHFDRRVAGLMILLLCLCQLAWAETAGKMTVYSVPEWITKHGNVCLVTDRRILGEDLNAAGIEAGDRVRVTFLGRSIEMDVARNYSETATGTILMCITDDSVQLAINMGDFASEYLADKTVNDDGSLTWKFKEGIEGPVEISVEVIAKGDGEDTGAVELTYSNNREDYPDLTDEEYANFRVVATHGMGEGVLYRSSTPLDPKFGRNVYADAAMRKAKVATIVNLVDHPAAVKNYEGYSDSYYSTVNTIELGLGMDFDTEEYRNGLAKGLRFIAVHPGPYAVHCREGKDRAGVTIALLECFMGASFEEVVSDYMVTFYNYFGIRPGDAQYDEIVENNITVIIKKLFDVADPCSADLAEKAESYIRGIGLTDSEVASLRANLGSL
ncbi:MAG: tyrosine-protein phosphatase [Clostridia bacterium]|nr:tyrosine-protein phosphatase [Clostridia bacterium]